MFEYSVAFVMPIVSRRYAGNWGSIQERLNVTLNSLCRQTAESWIAVVVGSELPEIRAPVNGRLHWVKCDIDIDDPSSMGRREIDKERKLHNAYAYLQDFSVSHIMPLDYDDLLSVSVVAIISGLGCNQGLLIKSGYVYFDGASTVRCSLNIYKRTGSCIAVPFRKDLFPTCQSDFDPPPPGYRDYPLVKSHIKSPVSELKSFECSFLQFRGAGVVWRRSSESVSRAYRPGAKRKRYVIGPNIDRYLDRVKSLFDTKPLTSTMLAEFGCDPETYFGLKDRLPGR